jgi:RsiW-degrading membrane proteinase PrsW (M82 family)
MAPGIFWLWYVYHLDVYEPEPKKLVLKTFVWGAAFSFMAAIIEAIALELLLGFNPNNNQLALVPIPLLFVICFFIIGPIEEFVKFLAVVKVLAPKLKIQNKNLQPIFVIKLPAPVDSLIRKFRQNKNEELPVLQNTANSIYDCPDLNEPIDGIVYSSAAALGFATFETIGYLFIFGWKAIFIRALVAVPAHVLFSSFWGYGIARGIYHPEERKDLTKWFALGAFSHGLWDFMLFSVMAHPPYVIVGLLLDLVLFFVMYGWIKKRIRWAEEVSPFKEKALHLFARPKDDERKRPEVERESW